MTSVFDTHVHIGNGKFASLAEWAAVAERPRVEAVVLSQAIGFTDNNAMLAARDAATDRVAMIVSPDRADHVDERPVPRAFGSRRGDCIMIQDIRSSMRSANVPARRA